MSSERERTGRSGFVAVIGRPNVGKSTFVNAAVGEKVAIVTPKPQTTRDRIRGIVTRPEGQIVLLDTPGVHDPRKLRELNRRMVQTAMSTLQEADALLHVVDAAGLDKAGGRPHTSDLEIRSGIEAAGRPAILALNKVDRLEKPRLLPIIEHWAGMGAYTEVVPICALKQADVDHILSVLYGLLPDGPLLYPADQVSDRSLRFTAAEVIREKVFNKTRQELPYSTAVEIDQFREGNRFTRIAATVLVERDSQKGIVIGKRGSMLKAVGTAARLELQELLGVDVVLDVHVKVESGWSDRPRSLDRLGYGADEGPADLRALERELNIPVEIAPEEPDVEPDVEPDLEPDVEPNS